MFDAVHRWYRLRELPVRTAALGGDVARLDPALDKLIDPDAKVEGLSPHEGACVTRLGWGNCV